MTVWIALLRAVNVGGRRVRMAELRAVCQALGFTGVRTFIASGNVVLASPRPDSQAVQAVLQDGLRAHFGFEVPVVVRTRRNCTPSSPGCHSTHPSR